MDQQSRQTHGCSAYGKRNIVAKMQSGKRPQ